MNTYIALFRGINVGGKNIIAMKDLKELLESIGLSNVSTYIQSGNVVFQVAHSNTSTLGREIKAAIGKNHGFEPDVFILTLDEMQKAAKANPFPGATSDPKTLHLSFLAATPEAPDLLLLEKLKSGREEFSLTGTVFYLYAPEGIGRSKLAEKVEKALGVSLTARNWRTVGKIIEIAEQITGRVA